MCWATKSLSSFALMFTYEITFQNICRQQFVSLVIDTAISLVHFTPNAYLISRKTIAKLTVLPSNS